MRRHPDFSLRTTNPIKRARAGVSRETVQEFFDYYTKSVEGIPPENIINYDETNFSDNPGTKKCLFKKGTKYCEQVKNTSKQAYSVMFSGTAAGTMLPPMVVYKAENLYPSWIERGPKGTKYSVSKNGWFGSFHFEQFFFEIALPYLKRKKGKKMLIGDNLSSHISPAVIKACLEHGIQFVCLPPHSTDKLQPLDVGVFGPVKKAWRRILDEFKARHPRQSGIQKSDFPRLLAQLWDEVDQSGTGHIP